MSDTMPSALHIFPPEERPHHNISMKQIYYPDFPVRKARLQEVEWQNQNQNLTLGPSGLLETNSSSQG